ncbi:hypothetical protein E2986_11523 [Frieseomelitta varia]|uniref:Uncharacterized protein n=1 Tax=Frieseomelitta varia TaxID=561572 RepID=A0A833R689_9HYME|nr:hypothetical protein E2986_11523 [Frieseomelitta varia]
MVMNLFGSFNAVNKNTEQVSLRIYKAPCYHYLQENMKRFIKKQPYLTVPAHSDHAISQTSSDDRFSPDISGGDFIGGYSCT